MRAADDLFFRQGAGATTLREITRACGLTPGALYNHFRSKEELLFRLVMRRHRLLVAALDDALATAPPQPVARLDTVVHVHARMHLRPRARRGSRVANREYRELSGAQLAQVVAVRRSLRDRVVAILEDGTAQGVFSVCGGGSGRRSSSRHLPSSTCGSMRLNGFATTDPSPPRSSKSASRRWRFVWRAHDDARPLA
jgi:AcrR family transcriptional regulator